MRLLRRLPHLEGLSAPPAARGPDIAARTYLFLSAARTTPARPQVRGNHLYGGGFGGLAERWTV
ncbi:hypothetical protein [Streptomyces sp. NPDC048611]|uniref:hypothetical protein n=1 Tax=unclassified Streptomyces TaxID=2593676 RepID=UPI00342B0CC0